MEHGLNRRRFLGAAIGTGAAAAAAAASAGALAPVASAQQPSSPVPGNRRGIQLYSLRRIMDRSQADARAVLRWLGRNGYAEVETAGHYGWTAAQFRGELERAGLRAASGHDGFDTDLANGSWQGGYREALEYAAELGQQYTGLAWFGPPYTEDRFRGLAQRMNEAGRLAREYGLQFFYHNHDFEFLNKASDGEPLYDVFLQETDRRLVKFEMDLFWIFEGGVNPLDYLSSDPGRFLLYHVKDHVWGDRRKADGSDEADWEDVGPGMLDFPDMFAAGHGRGFDKHFIIEHDWPLLSHPNDPNAEYKTARAGIRYLESVRW